jgi:hypothetical protein
MKPANKSEEAFLPDLDIDHFPPAIRDYMLNKRRKTYKELVVADA